MYRNASFHLLPLDLQHTKFVSLNYFGLVLKLNEAAKLSFVFVVCL